MVHRLVTELLESGWKPLTYAARRGSPAVTGRIDHPDWDRAEWTAPFVDIEGDAKPQPHFLTRAKMLWDEQFFYIAAELEEPHLWATLTEHDCIIFHDHDFEVFLDPDGAAERYYEFEINAFGTTWDLFLPKAYRDGGSAQNEWESFARSAVSVRGTLNDPSDIDEGWTVEMAFPWKEFHGRSAPSVGDSWRVNFSRVEWDLEVVDGSYRKVEGRPERNWVWSPQGVVDMHQPEMWGVVTFVD